MKKIKTNSKKLIAGAKRLLATAFAAVLSCSLLFSGNALAEGMPREFARSVKLQDEASTDTNAIKWEELYLLDQLRISEGLYPLSRFEALSEAAQKRADELDEKYAHERPNGESCFTILNEYKIEHKSAAENIARGKNTYSEPWQVMNGWYNSEGHKANMLAAVSNHVGMGYYHTTADGNDIYYWSQLFIGGCEVEDISVEAVGEVPQFSVGTTLKEICDMFCYRIVGHCEHGEFELPLTAQMCTGYDTNTTNAQEISVSCFGKVAKLSITLSEGKTHIAGDVNDNGQLDVGDATLILRYVVYLAGADDMSVDKADVNGDGVINTGDASALLQMIV